MELFQEATRCWFKENFEAPTEVQKLGWRAVSSGKHTLLLAPTGSGKTLAAFLWAIEALTRLPPDAAPGVRVVYVSPLKALAYDVERNLREPLLGVRRTIERQGATCRDIRVDLRTGDTPAKDRVRQARKPADILVTTPESLFLILGSRARETLRAVETVIVDEIHALAPTKRGCHLAVSLERLAELAAVEPQRIGLSATVRPHEEIARFLGGDRPVEVVDASTRPSLDLRIVVPVADMTRAPTGPPEPRRRRGHAPPGKERGTPAAPRPAEKGMWPALYPALLEEVRAHRSTILFVNSRGLCERLAQRLNELAGEELVRAHHGSVSREKRIEIEEGLKRGSLRGIVATSSLELGIDMGAVDRVVLVESPGSVVRGLQRVGRAGHQVGAVSEGRIYPKFRGDLLESAVVASQMLRGEIEALRVPQNPLDVLAQQVVALCCDRPRSVGEIEDLVRRASPYRNLSRAALILVLDMLSGRYPSTDFADLRPLLAWDRAADVLSPRRGAAVLLRMNAGTIPDRGTYGVFLGAAGPRLGELDEEMVFETRAGDNILLGASTWRVEEITRDRVVVSPAPGEPGRLPFWKGEGPGRPSELGRALGAFLREAGSRCGEQAVRFLQQAAPLDPLAARNLAAYLAEQREHTGTLPTDRAITVERFRDELGDWRICLLSPFGARVHAPWALALQQLLEARSGFEVQVLYTDDGIVLRMAGAEDPPGVEALVPDPEDVEELVTSQLGRSALFAGLFRENAARSLLLARHRPDRRTPLWAQRLKSQALQAAVERYPAFPVCMETYRQALADVFDLPALRDLLRQIRSREIELVEVETRSASPFARSLVFAYVAEFLYEQDTPLAERRAQALTLDRGLLAELLGRAELRELIDPQVFGEVDAVLQARADGYRARDADELHDLLRRLGDLTTAEAAERCEGDPGPWLGRLEAERRAVAVAVAGERRWIAAEDAGLYGHALGCPLPPGLPEMLLTSPERPLEKLLRRFASNRGPFATADAGNRFGLLPAQVEPLLEGLEAAGRLVRGQLGVELDWCDADVLRRLKRVAVAKLRREAAPVEAASLGRFLPAWHGVGSAEVRPGRLEEAISRLEGLHLPWSELVGALLPARVPDFAPDQLDALSAAGFVVWVGVSSLGPSDGVVALYRRENAAALLPPAAEGTSGGTLRAAILAHLSGQGASFLVELETAAARAAPGATGEEFRAALWDLVWDGLITNDTFAPLRSLRVAVPVAGRGRRRIGYSLAGGRWSLVASLRDPRTVETARIVSQARVLLERYGVVSREAAAAEGIPGGFGPLYRALRAMEEAGQVRRGYFVEGLSGTQFAQPGAVDRLRAVAGQGDSPAVLLAAMDPANPYGALLPWPESAGSEAPKPRRVPGAWVVLVRGRLSIYAAGGGRHLTTFPTPVPAENALEPAASLLHLIPRTRRPRLLTVETVDGIPALQSPHRPTLLRCGFRADYKGLTAVAEWKP